MVRNIFRGTLGLAALLIVLRASPVLAKGGAA